MSIAAFCGNCGIILNPNVRFCQSCGTPVDNAEAQPPAPSQPVQVAIAPSANPYACPRCREVDASRKVSNVVNESTTIGSIGASVVSGGYQYGRSGGPMVSRSAVSAVTATQTALSRVLSPPIRPLYRGPWGFFSVVGVLLFGAVGIFSLLLYLASLGISQDPTATASAREAGQALNPGALIVGVVCLVLAIWIIFAKRAEKRRRTDAYVTNLPLWERAMQNWDRLQYCMRCDGIYYPGQPQIYRANEMMNVIYHSGG
jgi:hypothetical protein